MTTKPFVPVPNTLQLDAVYVLNGERCENVFHVQGAGITDLSALANKIMDQYTSWETVTAIPLRSNAAQLLKLVVRDMGTQNGQVWERTSSTGIGTGGTPLPNNATVAIKWTTGFAGRSNRGRTFHIGLAREAVSGSFLLTTSVTALIAGYQALLAKLTDSTVFTGFTTVSNLVVVSKYTKARPAGPAVTKNITGVAIVDGYIDSQRRRLPGHNRHR